MSNLLRVSRMVGASRGCNGRWTPRVSQRIFFFWQPPVHPACGKSEARAPSRFLQRTEAG